MQPGAMHRPLPTFTAAVTDVIDLTHDVRQIGFRLVAPGEIRFAPGQFVSFEFDRPGAHVAITRAYSIASPPRDRDRIEIVLNRVPGGLGSSRLFDLHVDDVARFRGPAGSFTLSTGSRELLFVATGTGIAPFRSMLWWLVDVQPTRPVTLFWGLRSDRDVYYQEELATLRERLEQFSYVTTLSQPTSAWRGSMGRVTRLVWALTTVDRLEVFLCGNSGMIADVTAVIRGKGLCPIRREPYYTG